jgi:hypothetical protein
MISELTAAHEQVRALAAAVCDGELTPEQREYLVVLLHSLVIATACHRYRVTHLDTGGGDHPRSVSRLGASSLVVTSSPRFRPGATASGHR